MLQGAERPYRLMVESMQEGAITVSSSGLILYSNRRFAEMITQPLEQVLGASLRSFIAAADLPTLEALLSNLANGNCRGELTLETGMGGQLPCTFTLIVLPNETESAICIIVTDLTEQKRLAALERQAAEAREREHIYEAEKKAFAEVKRNAKRISHLQSMTSLLSGALTIEQIGDIVRVQAAAVVDANMGSIALLDDSGMMLNRVDGEESNNQPANPLMPSNSLSPGESAPTAEAARLREPIWIESRDDWRLRYPHLAAAIADVDHQAWSMIPLVAEQRLLGVLRFSFESPRTFSEEDRSCILTVAHQISQALDRALLYRAERNARREAEAADRLKLQFLAMISHELRTPLASIKGFSSTLLSEDVTWDADSQKSYLAIIDEEADKLTELIDQLLDVSRLAAGKLNVILQPTSLAEVIIHAMVRLESITAKHWLVIDIPPDLPEISADATRIAQVIGNLVGNAAKFSPTQTQITMSAFQRDSVLQVNISDEGRGIPPAERGRVFEAFQQVGSGE
jgi:PAS domain S-box-containing protein